MLEANEGLPRNDPSKDRFSELEGGDLPLGIMSGTRYEEYSAQLAPGQIVCVGTDGVWEAARSDGEMFGKARLRQAIRAAAAGTASDIETEVSRTLNDFLGPVKPKDDVTFVVVKISSAAADHAPSHERLENIVQSSRIS